MNGLTQAIKAIGESASSPYSLLALLALIGAWAYTATRSRRLAHVTRNMEGLSEEKRLEAIKLEYKTVPRSGISAEQWIRSQRQRFYLVGFLGTLVAGVLVTVTVVAHSGMRIPGGSNHAVMCEAYSKLDAKLRELASTARDMRASFKVGGDRVFVEDSKAEKHFVDKLLAYNAVRNDLDKNRSAYIDDVVRHFNEPEKGQYRVGALLDQALEQVHKGKMLELNKLIREINELSKSETADEQRKEVKKRMRDLFEELEERLKTLDSARDKLQTQLECGS